MRFSSSLLLASLVLLVVLVAQGSAHMWLRVPLSRGGVGFSGNTKGPCANKVWGFGNITTFQVNQNVTFQFRVNQHGPGPFTFSLSRGNDDFTEVLKSGIPNHVTAGLDGFNGVNVNVVLPSKTCDNCTIQLSGMAKADGTQTWYNCADIKILSASANIPKVTSVSPASGSTAGKTKINVNGLGFGAVKTNLFRCRFDVVIVNATWLTPTRISCTVPPRNAPSTAAVEVSVDGGQTFSSSGIVYTYTGSNIVPVISAIKPAIVTSGATITITGKYFYTTDMICKFTSTQGTAQYIPAVAQSTTKATCAVPEGLLGTVTLEVNVDGSDYSEGSSIQVKTAQEEISAGSGVSTGFAPVALAFGAAVVLLA